MKHSHLPEPVPLNPNRCPYCNAPNGSGCGHGLGGNQGGRCA